MVIAMTIMRMMKVAIDQIIDMLAMWHGFMTAARPMYMSLRMACALMFGRATFRIGRGYVYHMLIDMAAVRVMQMPVMQVIDVPVVHDTCMTTFRTMRMSMIFMLWQDTIGHFAALLQKKYEALKYQFDPICDVQFLLGRAIRQNRAKASARDWDFVWSVIEFVQWEMFAQQEPTKEGEYVQRSTGKS
ncbi:hypothetical protein [Nitrosospira briensis]|uniref:hypothetical protein n=1 Tax=Nitrosospira briensis TaxID=35799 RepID=UPI0004698ACF|nr:hypothetical protein [Nitrosospira briensis]